MVVTQRRGKGEENGRDEKCKIYLVYDHMIDPPYLSYCLQQRNLSGMRLCITNSKRKGMISFHGCTQK